MDPILAIFGGLVNRWTLGLSPCHIGSLLPLPSLCFSTCLQPAQHSCSQLSLDLFPTRQETLPTSGPATNLVTCGYQTQRPERESFKRLRHIIKISVLGLEGGTGWPPPLLSGNRFSVCERDRRPKRAPKIDCPGHFRAAGKCGIDPATKVPTLTVSTPHPSAPPQVSPLACAFPCPHPMGQNPGSLEQRVSPRLRTPQV